MKKFISGLVIGALLTGTVAFAASNLTAIKSAFSTSVNGKQVTQNIVTINGTYYGDIKQLAGNLGIKYSVDTKGKKITLGETPVANKYSMSNPAPMNTKQTIEISGFIDNIKAEMSVKSIVRGSEAWELIRNENQFNAEAPAGKEYILVKINFKLLDSKDGKTFDINNSNINLISSSGKEYKDFVAVVTPEPLNATLYKDASSEGYLAYLVNIDDKAPKIAFGRKYDGTGGIWFKAY